jgi:LmbE family N-acetylglucosaminyl deacetylase
MKQAELKPQRVLVLMAHPDDPEFSAGGTIARWTQAGIEVIYAIVTDGGKGSDDRQMTSEQLAALREEEQRAAAAQLGVRRVHFLGYPDGEVFNERALRRDLSQQIRLHKPDLVVTHDPTFRFSSGRINHPDHQAVGDTALNAVFPFARDRLSFPDLAEKGHEPHKVLDVLLAMTRNINHIVDISDTLESKLAALREHRSQIGDPEDLRERLEQYGREQAAGTPYTYAEGFFHISLRR